MNTNTNDILARIRNGEDPEKIANSFIAALNEANRIHGEEVKAKKEAEEKARKAKANDTARLAEANAVAKAMNDFRKHWFPDMEGDFDMTGEEMIDVYANANKVKGHIDSLMGHLDNLLDAIKETPEKSDEDVIGDFLNRIGL